jgi:hypothetical protein
MPPNTVKVDRSTRWGNPFTPDGYWDAGFTGSHEVATKHCVEAFRAWLTGQPHWAYASAFLIKHPVPDLSPLAGKNLACWCKTGACCHADVLLELANTTARQALQGRGGCDG